VKAPEHERMTLLSVAIERATRELRAPIDRIEVTRDHVNCWAGLRKVAMTYDYAQDGRIESPSGRFMPIPGSGNWEVAVVDGSSTRWPAAIGRGLAGIFKRRG
jgi:hypothetical protein